MRFYSFYYIDISVKNAKPSVKRMFGVSGGFEMGLEQNPCGEC